MEERRRARYAARALLVIDVGVRLGLPEADQPTVLVHIAHPASATRDTDTLGPSTGTASAAGHPGGTDPISIVGRLVCSSSAGCARRGDRAPGGTWKRRGATWTDPSPVRG